MKHQEFLKSLANPVPSAVLKKYPEGDVVQYWAESPELYSRAFGQTDDFSKYAGGHTGIDIRGPHRTPVAAAHDGIVYAVKTDRQSLGGLCLWIRSPSLDLNGQESCITTGYGHFDQIIVKAGQKLKQGDHIGYMGNTGFVISGGTPYWGNAPAGKGTHLHFTLYENIMKNGAWMPRFNNLMQNSSDPLSYLTKGKELGGLTAILRNLSAYLKLPKFRSA